MMTVKRKSWPQVKNRKTTIEPLTNSGSWWLSDDHMVHWELSERSTNTLTSSITVRTWTDENTNTSQSGQTVPNSWNIRLMNLSIRLSLCFPYLDNDDLSVQSNVVGKMSVT
jgi:hypothetical protein